jgi:hypothetical protein
MIVAHNSLRVFMFGDNYIAKIISERKKPVNNSD